MKAYGASKATEFSKKQIGVIYASAKRGELKVEKWVMSDFYNTADYYGYDDNGNVEECEREIMAIIEATFAGETEKAQELINKYTTKWFARLGRKARERADRRLVA